MYLDPLDKTKSYTFKPTLKRKLLQKIQAAFPIKSRLSVVLGRLAWGRPLKHMRKKQSDFELTPTQNTGQWNIYIRGNYLKTTNEFPAQHSVEKVKIITSGPSVNRYSAKTFKNEPLFAVNGAIQTLKNANLTPDFYTATDTDFFDHRMSMIKDAILSGAHCFFTFNGIARILKYDEELVRNGKITLIQTMNRFYMIPQRSNLELTSILKNNKKLKIPIGGSERIGWSRDPKIAVFSGKTIAFIASQIAAYITKDEVSIYGMDLGNPDNAPQRSYSENNKPRPTSIGRDYHSTILPAFQCMKSFHTGCKFFNMSLNSKLPTTVIEKPIEAL